MDSNEESATNWLALCFSFCPSLTVTCYLVLGHVCNFEAPCIGWRCYVSRWQQNASCYGCKKTKQVTVDLCQKISSLKSKNIYSYSDDNSSVYNILFLSFIFRSWQAIKAQSLWTMLIKKTLLDQASFFNIFRWNKLHSS